MAMLFLQGDIRVAFVNAFNVHFASVIGAVFVEVVNGIDKGLNFRGKPVRSINNGRSPQESVD